MKVHIEVSPKLSKLANVFNSVDLYKKSMDIIEEYARYVERYSKQVSPYKTGYMRGTISPEFGKSYAIIGTHSVKYAKFVHDGTSKMRARPFMKWGLEFATKKFNDKTFADKFDDEFVKKFQKL